MTLQNSVFYIWVFGGLYPNVYTPSQHDGKK